MTDEEALKEIDRQEKRFAAECAAANEKAVAMTAETDRMETEARQMLKEVSRRRSAVAKLRKIVRNGELIKNQEYKARLMFEEKVKRLGKWEK